MKSGLAFVCTEITKLFFFFAENTGLPFIETYIQRVQAEFTSVAFAAVGVSSVFKPNHTFCNLRRISCNYRASRIKLPQTI